MWRSWLHRLLGGRTDEAGRPVLGDDDWVEVFDGQRPDIDHVRQAFDDEGIESSSHVYVPLGAAYGRTADPRTSVSVRAPDADRANALLDAIRHLARRADRG